MKILDQSHKNFFLYVSRKLVTLNPLIWNDVKQVCGVDDHTNDGIELRTKKSINLVGFDFV